MAEESMKKEPADEGKGEKAMTTLSEQWIEMKLINQQQLQQIDDLTKMLGLFQQRIEQQQENEMRLKEEVHNILTDQQQQQLKYEAALESMVEQIRKAEDVHHEQITELQQQVFTAQQESQQLRDEVLEIKKQHHQQQQLQVKGRWYCIGST